MKAYLIEQDDGGPKKFDEIYYVNAKSPKEATQKVALKMSKGRLFFSVNVRTLASGTHIEGWQVRCRRYDISLDRFVRNVTRGK